MELSPPDVPVPAPNRTPSRPGARAHPARTRAGAVVMQLVPGSARRAADAWDEQHLEVAAAAHQLAAAPTGGFTEAVAGPAGAFADAWQEHAAGLARQAERFAEALRAAVADYLVTDDGGRRAAAPPAVLDVAGALSGDRPRPAAARAAPGAAARRRPGAGSGTSPSTSSPPPPSSTTSVASWPPGPGSATGRVSGRRRTTRRSGGSARPPTRCRWPCAPSVSASSGTPTSWRTCWTGASGCSRSAGTWSTGPRRWCCGPTACPRSSWPPWSRSARSTPRRSAASRRSSTAGWPTWPPRRSRCARPWPAR